MRKKIDRLLFTLYHNKEIIKKNTAVEQVKTTYLNDGSEVYILLEEKIDRLLIIK